MGAAPVGLRHFYTNASGGLLGQPGFQTVACARDLTGERYGDRRRALERIAAALGAAVQKTGAGTAALFPLPTDRGLAVLSRVEPSGAGPDGRAGNYWAESVVVPAGWLAASGWDLPAAFRAVGWRGPAAGETLPRGFSSLEGEPLPSLSAARGEEPARFRELAPEGTHRLAMLAALHARAEGRGGAGTLYLVEDPAAEEGDLEKLVLTLPRLLPRDRRTVEDPDSGEERCLRLVTRGVVGLDLETDVLGLPETELDEVLGKPGAVVDLGGRIEPSAPVSPASAEWAGRVEEALTHGGPDELRRVLGEEELVEERGRGRREDREKQGGSVAKEKRGSEEVTRRLDLSETPGERRESREALWEAREEAEERLGALSLEMSGDLEQALRTVEELRSRQARLVEAEIRALREEIRDGESRLRAEGDRSAALSASSGRGKQEREPGRDRAGGRGGRGKSSDAPMGALPPAAGSGRDSAPSSPGSRRPEPERATEEEGRGSRDSVSWNRPSKARSGKARSGDPRTQGAGRTDGMILGLPGWAVAALAVVVLIGVGWGAFRFLSPAGDGDSTGAVGREAASTGGPEAAPGTGTGDESTPDALRRAVVERLRRPEVAGSLLRRAVAVPDLESRAADTYLVLRFGAAGGVRDAVVGCGLLQQAVNGSGASGAALTVDADCGAGTRRALAAAVEGGPCAGGDWQAQGACLLARTLRDDGRGEACRTRWPLVRSCPWTRIEAAKLRGLLAATAAASSNTALREAVGQYDLAVNPDLSRALEAPAVDSGAIDELAALAVAAHRARPEVEGDSAFENMDADELEELLAFLDALGEGAAR